MFGRRKKKEEANEKTVPAEPANPFSDDEADALKALWRLTAPPREEFDATYGTMLAAFWRYVRAPKDNAWAVLKDRALSCAVAALRVGEARVLPRFAAAEDAARLAALARTLAPRTGCVHGGVGHSGGDERQPQSVARGDPAGRGPSPRDVAAGPADRRLRRAVRPGRRGYRRGSQGRGGQCAPRRDPGAQAPHPCGGPCRPRRRQGHARPRATPRCSTSLNGPGAPALGIEARRGRDPARRGSVRSTRARPKGTPRPCSVSGVRAPLGCRSTGAPDAMRITPWSRGRGQGTGGLPEHGARAGEHRRRHASPGSGRRECRGDAREQ